MRERRKRQLCGKPLVANYHASRVGFWHSIATTGLGGKVNKSGFLSQETKKKTIKKRNY